MLLRLDGGVSKRQVENQNSSVGPHLTPREKKAPRVTSPKNQAGGVGAVWSSVQHSYAQMGLIRSTRSLLKVNQTDGFDCPGCAWPDPDDRRAMTEFCENGAKAVAEEATLRQVDADFFRRWSVKQLSQQSDYWLSQQGRITQPMYLPPGQSYYQPIDWDQALGLVAKHLNALSSPHEALFYTSGRTSNEAAFLYQLLVRLYGTNNLPDCSNLCHESSGVALKESIGIGKGTVKLNDFTQADVIIVMGQNPGTNHPRMLSTLQAAVRAGSKVMSVNPLFEPGTRRFSHPQEAKTWMGAGSTDLTQLHVPVRINGDVALLKGWMKWILEKAPETLDRTFIQQKTSGFEAFCQDLEQESWQNIYDESGLSAEQIEESARWVAQSKATIVCWAMGLTQHVNAVANIQCIVNLLLMGGHFGRAGAGVCPVRGHSNVQGDRTMGIWERPEESFLQALEKEFNFQTPRQEGHAVVSAIEAMAKGDAKVLVAMGGNFLSASPDTDYTARALQNCHLTAHISTKLNRSHLITGEEALILPCLGRSDRDVQEGGEQFVTVENSMGIVHASRGNLKPASSHWKSEVAIVCELAEKLAAGFSTSGPETSQSRSPWPPLSWKAWQGDYSLIRDRIAKVIPGFADYNERIKNPSGFYLPNPIRDEQRFTTASAKALFKVHAIPPSELEAGQYLLMTIRSHDQYNTTVYGLDDRYRGIYGGRRVLLINAQDRQTAGFSVGQWVDIQSHFKGETRRADGFCLVDYDIPRGCLAAYFPETNGLVPIGQKAWGSHTPASKSLRVSLSESDSLA